MSLSLAALKERLQSLGVETSTPGLSGEQRLEELDLRLRVATNGGKISSRGEDSGTMDDPPDMAFPSLSHLTMFELRSRLSALGADTNTPGLAGDERRIELMKRLVGLICGTDGDDEDLADSMIDEMIDNNSLAVPHTIPVLQRLYPLNRPPTF